MLSNNNIYDEIEMIDVSKNNNTNVIEFSEIEMIDVSNTHNTKKYKYKKIYSPLIFSVLFIISFFLIIFNICVIYNVRKNNSVKLNQIVYNDATKSCSMLYENKTIKEDINIIEIDKCLFKIDLVKNQEKVKKLKENTENSKKYIILSNKINSYYDDNILSSNISNEDIIQLEHETSNLNEKYKNIAIDKINKIKDEYNIMLNAKSSVNNLFEIDNENRIKPNITRKDYNASNEIVSNLKQEDLKQQLNSKLNIILKEIEKKEKEEHERLEKIRNAWVKLNVSYISQNKFKVYNGCEAASLLMALKYKGYLQDMDLITFAKNMPKSNDPNTGFYLDIFSIEPSNVAHWIAPEPLVKYGISESGNKNIINSTGYELEDLGKEILNHNPVVIYLTSDFKQPYNWSNGAPKNLHVLLITGYNPITQQFFITDPWFYNSGIYQHTFKLDDIRKIYNAVGKKSIIIK